jgi:hypothetical protein
MSSARAWDAGGHMLCGEIAWTHSSPAVREKVAALLPGLDQRFSGGQPYNFTTVGCWMDDMRELKKDYAWSRWHYVEILKTPDASGFQIPEPPHAIWAIHNSLDALRDAKTAPARRSEALGILIHVVQDIHQPLHACGWNDRGGNGYLIYGVAFADLYKGGRPNLHAFWDQGYRVEPEKIKIRESWLMPQPGARPEPGSGLIAEEAKKIMAAHPAEQLAAEVAELRPEAWAKESYTLGCTKAYPDGPHPGETAVQTLWPEFAVQTREIAQRRVALAGYRLAKVLASLFAD